MQHERSFVRSRLINDSCGGKMRIPDEDTRWWISKCACNGLMPQVAANLLVWTRFGGLPVFDVFQSPIYSRSHWIIRVPYFLWLNILISGNTRSHSTRTFCWKISPGTTDVSSYSHWHITVPYLRLHHGMLPYPCGMQERLHDISISLNPSDVHMLHRASIQALWTTNSWFRTLCWKASQAAHPAAATIASGLLTVW
jgi:hypothetical protein